VHIAAADAAALDLNVDVVVAKRLGLELVLVEVEPGLGSVDLEPGELFRIRHGEIGGQRSEVVRVSKSSFTQHAEGAPRVLNSTLGSEPGGAAPHLGGMAGAS
jgi:hypothetical protein